MRDKRTFFLAHETARKGAAQFCFDAPEGWMVTFQESIKSREQEEKYHSMIDDIAEQCLFLGQRLHEQDWKRVLIDAFARVKAAEGKPLDGWGRMVPSLDGTGFVQLGVQSRGFNKSTASEFIEHLYAFGAEQDPPVVWTKE